MRKYATAFGFVFLLSGFGYLSAENSLLTISDCLDRGIKNYEPIKLADEEIELARIKKAESYRALFPAMSVKAEETNGDTTNNQQGFTERVYGGSLSQNLYEGGKVYATYKQADISFGAAQMSREKSVQDLMYTIRESYWNLVAATTNLKERENVQSLIKDDLKKITEQYVLDLAVKQQFLAVKAQYLQANTQVNQARKAFSKARWDLAKVLGQSQPVKESLVSNIPFKRMDIDLDECMALAASHRPDLKLQDDLVEIARQGRTVAGAANLPRFTFNSFYGKSASAYKDDALSYKDDWQVSLNLVQSFWGNSLALNGDAINTSPKVGESTRTKTHSTGANLNFMDGMKNRTEYKQADLNVRQAILKRDDLKRDIAIEVETSFYNVQQALLQVDFSEEDSKLADEEFRVVESKGRYGITGILELAQARNRLAQSRAARLDSLAGYQIALAALNRAIGIADKFTVE